METKFLPFTLGSLIALLTAIAALVLALMGEVHWPVAGMIIALGLSRLV